MCGWCWYNKVKGRCRVGSLTQGFLIDVLHGRPRANGGWEQGRTLGRTVSWQGARWHRGGWRNTVEKDFNRGSWSWKGASA